MVDRPNSTTHTHAMAKSTSMDFWVSQGRHPEGDSQGRHPEGDDEAWMHHNVVGGGDIGQAVTKLTDDFLHATTQSVFVRGDFLEGGAIFERRG